MTTSIDMAALRRLTDLNDVNKLLHDVLAKERAVQTELEDRLMHRQDMETELLSLTAATAEMLEIGLSDSTQLTGSMDHTAAKAQQVSRRVRLLDTAQANLVATLEKIDVVITRSDCVSGVQAALDAEDYERAAQHISTYQDIDTQFQAKTADGEGQIAEQSAILTKARTDLVVVVRGKLKEAVDAQDTAAVVRFLKLYKPLRMPDEGVRVCNSFLKSVVYKHANEELAALRQRVATNPSDPQFLAALSSTLRACFVCLRDHQAIVTDVFGREKVVELAKELLSQLDVQGAQILQLFVQHCNLHNLINSISERSSGPPPVDPVKVDGLLSDIRSLCACGQEFSSIMLKTMQAACAPKSLPRAASDALWVGALGSTIRELQGTYVLLEEYYMEQCLAKADSIDTVLEGSMMSSMLDDSFFVVKQSAQRALTTGSLHCFVSVLSLITTLLSGTFRQSLQQKLSSSLPQLLPAVCTAESGQTSLAAEEAAAPLNNACLSVLYIAKMRDAMEREALLRYTATSEAESVKSVLADLSKAGSDLKSLSNRACDSMSDYILQAVQSSLEIFSKSTFVLNDSQYSAVEMEDGWARPLCASLEYYLKRLSGCLASEVQQRLVSALLPRLLSRIETLLASRKFNLLGGLLLDKEARKLINFLTDITGQPVRDNFSRLSQMVTILTLENLEEMVDVWSDEALTWRLSQGEVKTVLSQRVEFDRKNIAALRL